MFRVDLYIKAAIDGIKGKGFYVRSSQWPKVRKAHLKAEPLCQWCNGNEKLEIHHCIPFHLDRGLELQDSNLITLCEVRKHLTDKQCHLEKGHLGDWKKYNPNVREECNNKQQKNKLTV